MKIDVKKLGDRALIIEVSNNETLYSDLKTSLKYSRSKELASGVKIVESCTLVEKKLALRYTFTRLQFALFLAWFLHETDIHDLDDLL